MPLNFTRGLSNWTQGNATVANGFRTVTFSGANLIANDPSNPAVQIYVCGEGDKFIVDGVGVGTIASVDSASQVTLDAPWSAASQTAVAYKIRRYNEVKTGEVAKYIQAAQTTGQDSNPLVSLTVDDSVARGKLRETGGNIEVAVGPTGTADGSLKAALRADPATGYASFPNGYKHNNPGFRNRLINGNFDIWQRGTSFTIANGANAYVADRWIIYNGTGQSLTVSRVAAPSGFLGQYALNLQANSVAADGFVSISQRCEARQIADLDSAPCVLAFDINASTSAGSFASWWQWGFNTAVDNGAFSAATASTGNTVPVGSARKVAAFSSAQMSGAKYGGALTNYFVQQSVTGNWNINLGAVQFEADPSGAGKANDFEFRPLPVELAMCQRYFETSYDLGVAPGTASVAAGPYGHGLDATQSYAGIQCPFRVAKRATPTVAIYSPNSGASNKIYDVDGAVDCTAGIYYATTAGFVAAVNGVSVAASHTITVSWTASAEL